MAVLKREDADIYYESLGEGKPLVLIMGIGGNVDWWGTGFRKRLAKRRRVVAFDNRGAGRTKDDGNALSIVQMAGDVAALLDHLQSDEKADVIGFSMGGMIAQELALGYGERVDKLILGSTSGGGHNAVLPTSYAMQLLLGMGSVDSARSAMDAQLKLLFPESFMKRNAPLLDSFSKSLFKNPMTRQNFERQLQAVLAWDGTSDRLHRLLHSTLVLHGTEDILIPFENGVRLHCEMSESTFVPYEGCGHGFAVQEPERVMADVDSFLGV